MQVLTYSRVFPRWPICREDSFTQERAHLVQTVPQSEVIEVGGKNGLDILGVSGLDELSSQSVSLERVADSLETLDCRLQVRLRLVCFPLFLHPFQAKRIVVLWVFPDWLALANSCQFLSIDMGSDLSAAIVQHGEANQSCEQHLERQHDEE